LRLLVQEVDRPLTGELLIPTSKYHAHRALILASLAAGTSRILGLSDARHVHWTVSVLRALGTRIEIDGDTFVVHGGPYRPTRESASVGSSGTTLYFMIGLASLASVPITLTAQKYFERRPIGPLLGALRQLGVGLDSAGNGTPPIRLWPGRPKGGTIRIAGTLSQWISGLLLLAPFAREGTVIEVDGELNERPYVALTIAMMARFGLHVDVAPDWRRFSIEPEQTAQPATIALPPDIGSAAFGLAVAALHPADIVFRGLAGLDGRSYDHPEAHFVDVLREMGLPMTLDPREGTVRVRHDGVRLRGVRVDCRETPDMLPILATLGTFAAGKTVLENVAHVRLKESDRVSAMLQLNRMGGRLEQTDNRLAVTGVDCLVGTELSSFNDHRVLMSLAVAASRARGESSITYPYAYRISYPRFLESMQSVGVGMRVESAKARTTAASAAGRVIADPDLVAATPITERVAHWARERPRDVALVDVGEPHARTLTWDELVEQADRLARTLVELGVKPGDPVAFALPNWIEFVVVALATLRVGAVCCPLMPIFRGREMAFALRRSRARVLFVPNVFRGRDYVAETASLRGEEGLAIEHVVVVAPDGASRRAPETSWAWHRYDDALAREPLDAGTLAARVPAPTAPAQLLFTSGTSGEPKGVLHRLDALTRASAMEVVHLGLGSEDCIFVPSPLAHQTGFLYGMWLAWTLGVPQVVQPVWDAERARRALHDYNGTFVQAATPFLADLVAAVEAGETAPPSLRIFVATGAAVPRTLSERATRVLGTKVCGAWGSTESCLATLSAPSDPPEKIWGTDGRPLAGVQVRIVDDEGKVLAPGQEGHYELVSRCLFEGYVDRADLTAEAMTPDGWYRTGDLAVLDAEGYLHMRGRVKDVINRGGEKVPVAEIEQLLYEHPAVAEVAIVAMPDARLGERACAFVVLRSGERLDFAAMQRYLDRRRVAKPYWPEALVVVDALPRNAVGKIQKYVLRERAKLARSDREKEQAS
jgi:3-phosphoshikimate 1-carboxyvinyltransferase